MEEGTCVEKACTPPRGPVSPEDIRGACGSGAGTQGGRRDLYGLRGLGTSLLLPGRSEIKCKFKMYLRIRYRYILPQLTEH